jgi:transposase
MVQGYSSQISTCPSGRSSFCGAVCYGGSSSGAKSDGGFCPHHGGYPHEQRDTYSARQFRLRGLEAPGREFGGFMLSINGLNRFYYLRDFHDMRCKYERVLSIIHQQLNQEPEDGDVFIVMSKDFRKIRLFSYDRRSYSLYEKKFTSNYRFMKVVYEGDRTFYSISWKDVVLLLESPIVKELNVR